MVVAERTTVLLLFAAALVSRILVFVVYGDQLIVGSDQVDYIRLGQKFAAGDLYGVLDVYWPPLFPTLLGIADLFFEGLILPAIVLALLAASLIVPLVYFLVRQSYGRSDALVAAVLAIFYPHLINSAFAVGSENIYLLLVTLSLITGWKAVTSDSLLYYGLTGAVVGLAYLTRPEAIGYPLFFIAAAVIGNFWRKDQFFKRSVASCGVLVIVFLVFAGPYLVYLKRETGSWTVSGKVEINTVMGDYEKVAAEKGVGGERSVSAESGSVLLTIIASNVAEINRSIPYLIPFGVTVFMSLGLFASGWGAGRLKREVYLISFCILTIIGYAAAVVQTRYLYILLPIVFGWTAKGILFFSNWLRSTANHRTLSASLIEPMKYIPAICLALLFLYLLPLTFFMRSGGQQLDSQPYEERAAGIWLAHNGGATAKVFSARKVLPFYAGAVQVPPKSTDIAEVLEQIRTSDIDYVVTSDRDLSRNPYLKGLPDELRRDLAFELVYDNANHPHDRIAIYKRK